MCAYNNGETKCGILFGGAERTDYGLNPKGDVWALLLADSGRSGRWELLLNDKEASDSSMPEPRNAASVMPVAAEGKSTQYLLTGGWAPFRQTWDDNFLLQISS